MLPHSTSTALTLISTLLLTGAGLAGGGWLGVSPMGALRPGATERAVADEARVARGLDAESGEVLRRMAVKEALVAELVAGRATLADVTDEFLVLNALRPRCMDSVRSGFPGETDAEKTAHNVIGYALPRVPDDARRAAVARRLRAELAGMTSAAPH